MKPRSLWRNPAILFVLQLSVCFGTILYSGVIEPSGDAPGYRADLPLRPQLIGLLAQKLRLMNDGAFMSLARVAIAAGIHSPERARDMVARIGEREEGLTVWIRAAAADRRLDTPDPAFAAQQLHGLVKGFAFWPQVTMGQPPLSAQEQRHVAESSADMFLARYAASTKKDG